MSKRLCVLGDDRLLDCGAAQRAARWPDLSFEQGQVDMGADLMTGYDGFVIAEEDLKIRGPGEILGTKQTGGLQFRIADLKRDSQWIPIAQHWASLLVKNNPTIINDLQVRWVGHKVDYQHA